jgi:hypothetical protein
VPGVLLPPVRNATDCSNVTEPPSRTYCLIASRWFSVS